MLSIPIDWNTMFSLVWFDLGSQDLLSSWEVLCHFSSGPLSFRLQEFDGPFSLLVNWSFLANFLLHFLFPFGCYPVSFNFIC